MQIQKIMTRRVDAVPPESTIREAARKMKDLNVGSLPVREGSRVIGIVTDRDIATRAVAEGRDPEGTHVSDVMTRPAFCCHEADDVKAAAKVMADHQVRRIPVLNEKEEMVGILALSDMLGDRSNRSTVTEAFDRISKRTA